MLNRDIAMLSRSPWLAEPLRFIIKKHGKTMRAMQRAADKSSSVQTRTVTATVIAVLKEFQQVECTVTTDLPRVVEAQHLEPNSDHTY